MTVDERLAELGYPTVGLHPGSGEPFVEMDLRVETHYRRVYRLPPSPPEREYWSWDDDGVRPELVRMTDEQFAEAWRAYEVHREEFRRTDGVFFVPGPDEVSVELRTARGDPAVAVLTGPAWRWVRY